MISPPIALEAKRIIEASRIRVSHEAEAQADIAAALERHGLPCRREVILSPGNRIDLMVGSVAIEVKARQPRRTILRQLERYAGLAQVDAIVLATATAWPPMSDVGGKPFLCASLAIGWH